MKTITKKERDRMIFYASVVILPVIQFIIFYIVVNFRSIMFAFQSYGGNGGFSFVGFNTFAEMFKMFGSDLRLSFSFKNSILLYASTLLVGTGGAVIFSNYIYKKNIGHKLFQVVLFLPHIISGIVLITIYEQTLANGIPQIAKNIFGIELDPLLSSQNPMGFYYILFFQLWMGFGTQVLMYTSTMSGISPEIVESAELEGITPLKELVFITLPMIYPTFVTFITVGIAGLFTNQMSLYSFYGDAAPDQFYTLGYYLFRETQWASSQQPPRTDLYPVISAIGISFTAIAVPLTFGVKRFMEKVGPSVE